MPAITPRTLIHWRTAVATAALLCLATSATLAAQAPDRIALTPTPTARALSLNRGSVALWQLLLKLHTRASMLHITAHPDDEDGGMLAYESRGQGARVALLTLNRGESGQNAMSNDYWDALGLVRTEELLGADRYYGVRQYFTTVVDFGFSKTKEQTLQKWGYNRVLGDVVRVVRMVRPLVITSSFVGAATDGHGNHQVAGEMAQEVFKAAADPHAFPDQIRAGLRPWAPLKMYARAPFFRVTPRGMFDYATGQWTPAVFPNYIDGTSIAGQPSTALIVPEGEYNPLLGASYIQISRAGLGLQKSQNGGPSIPEAGPMDSPYHRYGSRVPTSAQETGFFQGIDVSLPGIADLAQGGDAGFLRPALVKINGDVEEAMRGFSAQHPETIAPLLAAGLQATDALLGQVAASDLSAESKYNIAHELRVKQAQFNNALALALEFSLEATVAPAHVAAGPAIFGGTPATFEFAIPGQQFNVRVHVADRGGDPVHLNRVWLAGPQGENWTLQSIGAPAADLAAGHAVDQQFRVAVPDDAAPTAPYFTRPSIEQPYYNLLDSRYQDLPWAPYPLSAWAEFTYDGARVRVAEVVQVVQRQTGLGTVLEPLAVAPVISVAIQPSAGIVPLGEKEFPLTVAVRSQVQGPAQGTVRLVLPAGWQSAPASATFSAGRAGDERSILFQVKPDGLAERPYTVTAIAGYNGRQYTNGFVTTGYPGLRPYNLYRPAVYRTSGVDVRVAPHLNVGYITGTGDDVPQALQDIGIKAHFLSAEDIASGNLQQYDVILLGIRTYAARPELIANNARLLNYVKQGGVIVVQYQTPEYNHDFGPYPYNLGTAEKVMDDQSSVQFLEPNNPVLVWPNRISAQDFRGWIEERGHDFMGAWDSHYQAPLEMHDPGQAPQKGGLLYARYGKGAYVYVSLALYRELPEGVAGAYRLMANLLSLPRNPQLK